MCAKIFQRGKVAAFYLPRVKAKKKLESSSKRQTISLSGTAPKALGIKLQEMLKKLMLNLHDPVVFWVN